LAVLLFTAGYCFGSRESGEQTRESSRQDAAEFPSEPASATDSSDRAAREEVGKSADLAEGGDEADEQAQKQVKDQAGRSPGAASTTAPSTKLAKAGQGSSSILPGGGARVSVVIDDLGRSLGEVRALRKLGVPITYAVLPFETRTPEVVASLRQAGEEILCHLPMEPRNGANPGPGALRTSMDPAEIRTLTRRALEAVGGAVGVNNHMGSSLTANPQLMSAILEEISDRRLFFLDSRTSAESVGYRLASQMGIASAERQVFLDPDPSDQAVRHQFRRLLDLARRRGAAIAIGHPYDSTLRVLAEEIPRAKAQGYDFVPVSFLLDSTGGLPEP